MEARVVNHTPAVDLSSFSDFMKCDVSRKGEEFLLLDTPANVAKMNMVMMILGFAVSSLFIFLFFIKNLWRRMRVAGRRPEFDAEATAERVHRVNGFRPFVIDSLLMTQFESQAFCSTGEALCSICLGEYQEKDKLLTLPACGHNFHLTCIDIWLQRQPTCPICRLSLLASLRPKILPSTLNNNPESVDSLNIAINLSPQQRCCTESSSYADHEYEQVLRRASESPSARQTATVGDGRV